MLELEQTVLKTYENLQSIKATAKELEISEQKVRKILLSLGAYESKTSNEIAGLLDQGYSVEEIAKILEISPSTVSGYMPYSKCIYNSETPSENALRIRKSRTSKA